MDDLKTLRAACVAVAPLPWRTILHEDDRWYVADANGDDVACCDDARYGESLARYLVAAANAAEALEAELDEARRPDPVLARLNAIRDDTLIAMAELLDAVRAERAAMQAERDAMLAERDAARAEVARLRGLLDKACDMLDRYGPDYVARSIRREGGLTDGE